MIRSHDAPMCGRIVCCPAGAGRDDEAPSYRPAATEPRRNGTARTRPPSTYGASEPRRDERETVRRCDVRTSRARGKPACESGERLVNRENKEQR